jgi:hypothetical protein
VGRQPLTASPTYYGHFSAEGAGLRRPLARPCAPAQSPAAAFIAAVRGGFPNMAPFWPEHELLRDDKTEDRARSKHPHRHPTLAWVHISEARADGCRHAPHLPAHLCRHTRPRLFPFCCTALDAPHPAMPLPRDCVARRRAAEHPGFATHPPAVACEACWALVPLHLPPSFLPFPVCPCGSWVGARHQSRRSFPGYRAHAQSCSTPFATVPSGTVRCRRRRRRAASPRQSVPGSRPGPRATPPVARGKGPRLVRAPGPQSPARRGSLRRALHGEGFRAAGRAGRGRAQLLCRGLGALFG